MTCEPESKKEETIIEVAPEPFEKSRLEKMRQKITAQIHADTPYERKYQEYYQEKEKSRTRAGRKRLLMSRPRFYPSRRVPSTVSSDRSLIPTG